jgi:hypothetical protein
MKKLHDNFSIVTDLTDKLEPRIDEILLDERGDTRYSGELRRAEATFSCDELVRHLHSAIVARVFLPGDDDRLEHSVLTDRIGEILEVLLVELFARLIRVRADLLYLDPEDRIVYEF